MKTLNVTATKIVKDQTIGLTVADPLTGKEISRKRYLDIRGGISWPTPYVPAYFCILGQEVGQDGNDESEGKRVLLAEHEDRSSYLDKFYERLIVDAAQVGCRKFYAAMPEDRQDCGYLNDFNQYARKQKSSVTLHEAKDADDFLLGINRIQPGTHKGSLILPEDSLVREQLSSITAQDIEDKPGERYNAINGLRHALGSFFRYPAVKRKPHRMPPPANWRAF